MPSLHNWKGNLWYLGRFLPTLHPFLLPSDPEKPSGVIFSSSSSWQACSKVQHCCRSKPGWLVPACSSPALVSSSSARLPSGGTPRLAPRLGRPFWQQMHRGISPAPEQGKPSRLAKRLPSAPWLLAGQAQSTSAPRLPGTAAEHVPATRGLVEAAAAGAGASTDTLLLHLQKALMVPWVGINVKWGYKAALPSKHSIRSPNKEKMGSTGPHTSTTGHQLVFSHV